MGTNPTFILSSQCLAHIITPPSSLSLLKVEPGVVCVCVCTCVWVCKTEFFCPTNEMNEIIWNGMAVGGCPFPGIHLENLNPSPSIILRAQRKSVTRLHRWTQLIHLIFLRSRGIMVMTESELGTSESQTQASHPKATLPLS